jgi:uncharacterized protein YndB with AHSA1/START domain
MLKRVAMVVLVLVAAVLLFAATKPDTFRVQRAASIKAPPERIFPLINDFQRWAAWSPWEKKDPAMKRTLGLKTSGTGAAYTWEGNGEVGKGRMEITASSPPSQLTIQLDFERPFETRNSVEFTLAPEGEATSVTWAMEGRTPYFAKIIHLFFDMDSMVGKAFEAGLASLKAIAEGH